MKLSRVLFTLLIGMLHTQLVSAGLLANLIYYITLGIIDLNPDPDGPYDLDDELPSGVVNLICSNLVDVVGGLLADQIPEELQEFVDPDAIECGCELDGRDVLIGCNLAEQICVDLETSTNGTKSEVCGDALYRGRYKRPLLQRNQLQSAACVELTTTPGPSTLSKLCVLIDHGAGIANIDTIEDCTLYAVRKNGDIDECKSCSGCPNTQLAVKVDCSNVDFDEDPNKVLFLPKVDQCVATGLVSTSALESGTPGAGGLLTSFLEPVN